MEGSPGNDRFAPTATEGFQDDENSTRANYGSSGSPSLSSDRPHSSHSPLQCEADQLNYRQGQSSFSSPGRRGNLPMGNSPYSPPAQASRAHLRAEHLSRNEAALIDLDLGLINSQRQGSPSSQHPSQRSQAPPSQLPAYATPPSINTNLLHPLQTRRPSQDPSIERLSDWNGRRGEAWSPHSPPSSEDRQRFLFNENPTNDLRGYPRDRTYQDQMEENLDELIEEERRKKKRARARPRSSGSPKSKRPRKDYDRRDKDDPGNMGGASQTMGSGGAAVRMR